MEEDNIEIQTNELLVLESMYDERQFIQGNDGKGGQILIAIELQENFEVSYSVKQNNNGIQKDEENDEDINEDIQTMKIKYLPPVMLNFSYPVDYPSISPPSYTLSCKWLTWSQLALLCKELDKIWNDQDFKCEIIFEWVQYLSENTLSLLNVTSPLLLKVTPRDKKHTAELRAVQDVESLESLLECLVDYDKKESDYQFSTNYFSCRVCFSEKLGSQCAQFPKCGHVYCKECMKEYFRIQILDGSVRALTCPEEKCETQADPNLVKSLVTTDIYEKYEKFLLQSTLECMGDITYCPRCQSPVIKDITENMGRCANCTYIFCILCKRCYHGVSKCSVKSEELRALRDKYLNGTEEERSALEKQYGRKTFQTMIEDHYSEEWLKTFSKQCPSCKTCIEKIDGCNKMTCFKCRKNFCWLCGKILSSSDPYLHFNEMTGCFNKLFEGTVPLDFDDDDDEDAWLDFR